MLWFQFSILVLRFSINPGIWIWLWNFNSILGFDGFAIRVRFWKIEIWFRNLEFSDLALGLGFSAMIRIHYFSSKILNQLQNWDLVSELQSEFKFLIWILESIHFENFNLLLELKFGFRIQLRDSDSILYDSRITTQLQDLDSYPRGGLLMLGFGFGSGIWIPS